MPLLLKNGATPWFLATAFAVTLSFTPQTATAQSVEESFAVALIRDAMAALGQANATGNYTVLRDYSARAFRDANDSTDLAAAFARLRAERLNLLQALVVAPVIQTSSTSLNDTAIRLAGYIPVEGRAISFDMEFLNEGGNWRIFGLSVGEYIAPTSDE